MILGAKKQYICQLNPGGKGSIVQMMHKSIMQGGTFSYDHFKFT